MSRHQIKNLNIESQAECLVSGPIAIVLRVSRFFGLAPLRFVRSDKGWRISLSPRLYTLGCFAAIIPCLITTWRAADVFLHQPKNMISKPTIQHITVMLGLFMASWTWALMVGSSSNQMRCYIASLNHGQKIASELNENRWSLQWNKVQTGFFISWITTCVTFLLADFTVTCALTSCYRKTEWVDLAFPLRYGYIFATQLGIISFIFLVQHVLSSFKSINYCLKNLLQGNMTNSPHGTVRRIAIAYVSACNTVRHVNSAYGPVLMMLLTATFFDLVSTPYYFITHLILQDRTSSDLNVFVVKEVLQLFWIVFHVANLIALIEPCHSTHTEVELTRKLVSQLIRHVHLEHDQLSWELDLFSQRLLISDVCYRPLSVATMGRSLVLTILGSISTYLVILINCNNYSTGN